MFGMGPPYKKRVPSSGLLIAFGVGGNLLVLDRGEELLVLEFRDVRHGSSLQKARAVIGIAHRIRSDGTRGLFGLRVVNLEGLHGTTLVALVCVTAPAAL